MPVRPRRSKYGVRLDEKGKLDRTVAGRVCASKGEAERYRDLLLAESIGEIRHLLFQRPRMPLVVNGHCVGHYIPDFTYEEKQEDGSWVEVIEDFKGALTPVYVLKRALVRAIYGKEIRETGGKAWTCLRPVRRSSGRRRKPA